MQGILRFWTKPRGKILEPPFAPSPLLFNDGSLPILVLGLSTVAGA